MTYLEYIRNEIVKYSIGVPIKTKDISEKLSCAFNIDISNALKATSVCFNRLMKNNTIKNLRFYHKGIYYLTEVTPFGEIGINKEALINEKYALNDNGYETGYMTLHKLGLSTQIPQKRIFASNNSDICTRFDKKLDIEICPPKTKITKNNKKYLQLLDAIDLMDKAPIDSPNPNTILFNYIIENSLKFEILLSIAYQFYNKKTIIKVAEIASIGGLNEFAS